MNHTDFGKLFQPGYIFETEIFGKAEELSFTVYNIGELVLTSGKLVACDPLLDPHEEFAVSLTPGCYPVILSVAQLHNKGDKRTACAMLRISDRPPVQWEMATRRGENLSSLAQDERFGYGVDSGTGGFMDADTAEILTQLSYSDDYDFWEKIIEEMEQNKISTWDWANFCVDTSTGLNVISFSSGWGDGFYTSYWGYDDRGKIVSLVTDFALWEHPFVAR